MRLASDSPVAVLAVARPRLALLAGLAAGIALAELLIAVGAPGAGFLVDAALVLALANGVLFARSRARARLMGILALVPLIRPVAMAMSFGGVPPELSPVLAGAPLLAGVLWASREIGFPLAARLLPASRAGARIAAVAGPVLGLPAFLLVGPARPELGTAGLLAAAVGLAVFVALQQELLFRGLLQELLGEVYGARTSTLAALSALFGVTLLGASLAFGIYMGALAMVFSEFVRRYGTLGEVVICHAGVSVFGVLVWPLLLG